MYRIYDSTGGWDTSEVEKFPGDFPGQQVTIKKAVDVTVDMDQVQADDQFVLGDIHVVTVKDVKVGTKWVELRDSNGKMIDRRERKEQVTLRRWVETSASVQARRRADANKAIQEDLKDYRMQTAMLVQELHVRVINGGMVTSNMIEEIMMGQATDAVYARWAKAHDYLTSEERGEARLDSVAARQKFCDDLQETLIRNTSYGASRSTSPVYNLADDMERTAQAKFIEDGKFYR